MPNAARSPMIATTASISMSVNPFFGSFGGTPMT